MAYYSRGGGSRYSCDVPTDGRIYVGNLPPDIRERDIEDLFFKYGRILNIDLKMPKVGPPFAFVEFEDKR